jgi:hypothetical protein
MPNETPNSKRTRQTNEDKASPALRNEVPKEMQAASDQTRPRSQKRFSKPRKGDCGTTKQRKGKERQEIKHD